jgi:two-component system, NarL family, sensor histidine kinase EvgS
MPSLVDLTNKNILVVEDDDMNYIYISQIFKLTKGNIIRAKNGKTALELAKKENFDIILMDIKLPDINGQEITRRIRQFNTYTPIIAQTASRTPDETDEAIEAGCTAVLIKPYTIDEFSELMSQFV